ncbi:MAG: acyltransferase [Patescibacteria group bacterium]
MIVLISNPLQATWIFSVIFFLIIFATVRPRQISEWLPATVSAEIKGAAIIMIVLSHIGYFLVNDTRFLWPLSIMAGVGVNLFLFLSGFGLTASQLSKDLSIRDFYKRRLLKIFVPYWLLLVVVLLLDIFFLNINYSWQFIFSAGLGIITHADLYSDFNSPLWYFTFIIGYYLLFPLVFSRRRPWLSAIVLGLVGYGLIYYNPVYFQNVLHLYRVHIFAFPLGVLAAWLVTKLPRPNFLANPLRGYSVIIYWLAMIMASAAFIYFNVNSAIGASYQEEQLMSLIAMIALVVIFIIKKFEFKALSWVGIYSYEIYLWHWPLMYRYDIFYRFMPAWLATILYLVLFIPLAWLLAKLANLISTRISPR